MVKGKDLIRISVENSYGDTSGIEIGNPTCGDLMSSIISAAQVLGFSQVRIYTALEEAAEVVKQNVLY